MSGERTAVCTVATGPHEALYEISGPSFERFAAHHRYDLIVVHHDLAGGRPPAWAKLVLLRELLDAYERVVWLDADAVVVDASGDIFEATGLRRPLCMAVHRYDDLEIPNMGVVAIRSTSWTRRFLERLWAMDAYIDHKWWENAAVLELMGYDVEEPRRDTRRRTLTSQRVGELDLSWNSIALDPSLRPRIVHFPGMSHADRLAEMRHVADLFGTRRDDLVTEGRRAIVDDTMGRQGLALLSGATSRR